MQFIRSMAIAALCLSLLAGCVTGPAAKPGLQGTWTVVAAEHEGKPMEVVLGGTLDVTGERFTIRTASGNQLRGMLTVNTHSSPKEMDLVQENGTRWLAIYDLTDTLRINYVDAVCKEPRPKQFVTSDETEASLMTLQRRKP